MCHHVPPCTTMYHHVPPCTTMYHHVPPCTTMYHHVPPCTTMYHHVPPYHNETEIRTQFFTRSIWIESLDYLPRDNRLACSLYCDPRHTSCDPKCELFATCVSDVFRLYCGWKLSEPRLPKTWIWIDFESTCQEAHRWGRDAPQPRHNYGILTCQTPSVRKLLWNLICEQLLLLDAVLRHATTCYAILRLLCCHNLDTTIGGRV